MSQKLRHLCSEKPYSSSWHHPSLRLTNGLIIIEKAELWDVSSHWMHTRPLPTDYHFLKYIGNFLQWKSLYFFCTIKLTHFSLALWLSQDTFKDFISSRSPIFMLLKQCALFHGGKNLKNPIVFTSLKNVTENRIVFV